MESIHNIKNEMGISRDAETLVVYPNSFVQVMNIGGGSGISIIDLVQLLKEITHSTSEILFAESQKGDAEHTLADTKRAKELIGYEPGTSIREGLKKFVKWYIKENA